MKTKYRLRKKTDNFGETVWLIEQEREPSNRMIHWWPVGCYATEERALEVFETVGTETEEILKEKEV